MNCLKELQRFFSGIMAVAFFATNTLTPVPVAHAANVESPAFISSFTIPAEFGKVTERVKGSGGGPLLIHIQEAHANYDAQKNIKNILEHLSENYGIRLVLLEGAGNKLTPGLFNFFPQEPELQQAVNEKLMQAGELTGAETFMISDGGDRKVEAWGVEKAEAYAKNREAFKRVFEGRKLAQNFLATFYRQWQKYASLLMSKPLKEFLTRETAFKEGRLPLADWMASLKMAAARDLRLDLDNVLEQKDWPVLVRYFRLRAIDPKIDAAKVETEQKEFLAEISALESGRRKAEGGRTKAPSIVKEIMDIFERATKHDLPAYKTRFVFERLLDQLPKDFSFDAYPNFRLSLQKIILLSELQGDALQDEINNLTGKLTTSLIKTGKDRQLTRTLHNFHLVKKLFELELSRSEYQTILSDKITLGKFLQELQAQDPKTKTLKKNSSGRFARLESLYGTAIHFYEGAIEREDRMMERAIERMRERKQTKAVLITGGFHAAGLKEKALNAGNSYIEITPRIGEVTADSRKHYLTALLGKKAVETSQIPAAVRTDIPFWKVVFAKDWRRKLAEDGTELLTSLRQVVGPERAQELVRSFLTNAVGVPASQPAAVRSETRASKHNMAGATPDLPELTLGIPLDIGFERQGTAIVEFGALKKAARLLEPLKESFGMGRVYPYNSLFATGDISPKVHQVPNKGEHFVTSGNGKTTVMVGNYETKGHELDGLTLRDGPNNFSIRSMLKLNPRLSDSAAGPGTVERTEGDVIAFNKKAHSLGIKTMADFIPWLAPDAIDENNLDWTFHERLIPAANRYFRGLSEQAKQSYINGLLQEKKGAFFARRLGEGDQEEVVLIRNFPGMGEGNYNVDQVLLNIFSPGVQDYYKRSLRYLKGLGFDAVRGDMGSYLLKKNLAGFFKAAGLNPEAFKGTDPLREVLKDASMEVVFEAYDPDDQEALIEAGAPSPVAVYDDGFFKALIEFASNPFEGADKIGKKIEEALLYGIRNPGTKKHFLLYPTNFDQNSLDAMAHYPEDLGKGFSVAGVLALSLVTAYLAEDLGVFIVLRDILGQSGDVRPIVGGDITDRHAALHGDHAKPFVNTAEELAARTDIRKLERAIREAPAAKFKRELMATVKGSKQNFIRLLDNANLNYVVSLGWRTEKGEWVVFAVNLRPRQGPMDLRFVEFPSQATENVPLEGWEAKDALTGERLPIIKEHHNEAEFSRILGISFKDMDYRLIVLTPKEGGQRSEMRAAGSFLGSFTVAMDNKNRVNLPARFQKLLSKEAVLIAEPEENLQRLRIYDLETWQTLIQEARPQDPVQARSYDDQTHSRVLVLTVDRQGRVNLGDARRRKYLGISDKELTIAGAGDSFLVSPVRSEMRQVENARELSWVEVNTPRLAKHRVYSRQWECGLPMDLLQKIEDLYDSHVAGEVSQATLTGGLGALMPDLFEAWTATGMNVTGIHPLWNFIKNKPLKGVDAHGLRKFLGEIAKQQMEDTGIEFDVALNVPGDSSLRNISFRVYKTKSTVHKAPQYYLDAFETKDGKEEPAFLEVYNDEGKREIDMAFFEVASERLIQVLEKDPNPSNVVIVDHEVFVSLPMRYLKKAKRVTLNHTVFRPGLFEAWEGYYEMLNFPEWLRSTITHDGKISIADFTAEVFHLITGVNLVEHLPALLKNIFRAAWHRVVGFYDQAKQIRSTNGIFFPRWQSPATGVLIQRYKDKLQIPRPENKLPAEANDHKFFEELDKNPELREQFAARQEWVAASDGAKLLIWLRQRRGFKGASDWLGNTFRAYQEQHPMSDAQLMDHLEEMQALILKAASDGEAEDWLKLEEKFGQARDLILGDPIVANVRRQVPYKGPDKYEEILSLAVQEAATQSGLSFEMEGARPFSGRFKQWKENKHDREAFRALRGKLKDQTTTEALRKELCRVIIGGRTFDEVEAHDRFLYIRFLTELLGLEDRIATFEDYTYYEAQIIFRGVQGGVMLSDEDLEASATSQMKVKRNKGEVVGPYAGSNPEIWDIRDKKTQKRIEVLNEKGEPNTTVITQNILREKLRTQDWEIRDGVFVAYDDGEKSMQIGGGRRPSARSLLEALKEVKRLRSDPATRRERMYAALSNSWKVDMVTGQAMAHAYLIENMLREAEERDAMFDRLRFELSDYAVPLKAPDFGWKTRHPFERYSVKLGLFGLFRSFRDMKTWQDRGPATRGIQALESVRHHAQFGDIFKYLREGVLVHLSPGLQPFKEKIKSLAVKAETASDKELIALNLEAMDLTEMLLVRMAGDWFERYMEAGPSKAEPLRQEITQGVSKDYQPWAVYIDRYLEGHPDARALRTHENKIQSFVFTPPGKRPVMVNINAGAPVNFEEKTHFKGYKARTQVIIDEKAFGQLTEDAPDVRFIKIREPKFGENYNVHPRQELVSKIGVGIPMPLGVEVLEWRPVKLKELTETLAAVGKGEEEPLAREALKQLIQETGVEHQFQLASILVAISKKEPSAMDSLKQMIRETRAGYEPPEGKVSSDHFSEQLEVLAGFDQKNATEIFGENLKPLMTLIGLFRPDLLKTSQIASWDPGFYRKIKNAITAIQNAFGETLTTIQQHHYYVVNASHHSSLVLAREDAKGNAFFISFQFAASSREVTPDGKIYTRVSSEGLTKVIGQGVRYGVRDMLTNEDYGERGDLIHGWIMGTPFANNGDRVQFLRLERKSTVQRSEMRTELPQGLRYQDQARVVEPADWFFQNVIPQDGEAKDAIDRTIERLSEIISGAVRDPKPVLLRGVAVSSDDDQLLEMLGFASVKTRQDAEREILFAISNAIRNDPGIEFRGRERVLQVFTAGERKELVLKEDREDYSELFNKLITNRLKSQGDRLRGANSFDAAVRLNRIAVTSRVKVEYGLRDFSALADSLSLDPEVVKDAVITQAEYENLPATKPAENTVAAPKSVTPPSPEMVFLSEILSQIRTAWTAREAHWAVQRVNEETAALVAWDQPLKDGNAHIQQAERVAVRQDSEIAADIFSDIFGVFPKQGLKRLIKQKTKAIDRRKPLDETPYQKILEREASLRTLINSPIEAEGNTAVMLRKRIEKIFNAMIELRELIGRRAFSMSKLYEMEPTLGIFRPAHPEVQHFLAKHVAHLLFVRKTGSEALNDHEQEFAGFVDELFKRKDIPLERKGQNREVSSSVARGALTDLRISIQQRKDFYDVKATILADTIGRMYGDILRQIAEISGIKEDQAFMSRFRQMLNDLGMVLANDDLELWFTGIDEPSVEQEITRLAQMGLIGTVMEPFFADVSKKSASLTSRSEIRTVPAAVATALMPSETITDMNQLITENVRLGGGQLQGFRDVTEKITDGIWSLTAHTFHAVKLVTAFFFPTALSQKTFNVASVPATGYEQKRFADARKVLLGGKILGASDVLILAPEFGVDLGAALLMRKIVGDAPIAVLVRNDTDRKFLGQINIKLRQANRPLIFPAATPEEASQFLGRSVRGAMNIKPMVSSGEKNVQAGLLLQQYGNAVITVTPKMYQNFLNLAGVSEVISRLRDEYLATARSA